MCSREAYELYGVSASCYDELYGFEQYDKYSYVYGRGYRAYGLVVDIGCGTGLFLEFLSKNKGFYDRYVCIEPSIGMLEKFLDKKLDRDYRVLVINSLWEYCPLASSVADRVYAFTVWDNVSRKEEAFKELVRITACNGVALVSFLKVRMEHDRFELMELAKRYGVDVEFIGCNRHDCFIVLKKKCT